MTKRRGSVVYRSMENTSLVESLSGTTDTGMITWDPIRDAYAPDIRNSSPSSLARSLECRWASIALHEVWTKEPPMGIQMHQAKL